MNIEESRKVELQPWRLLAVGISAEHKTLSELQRHRLVGYLPIEKLYVGSGPRRRIQERPLVRGYVFARIAFDDLAETVRLVGARSVIAVSQNADYAMKRKLVEKFVTQLQAAEAEGEFDHTPRRPVFAVGNHVTVTAGKFAGMAGVISQMKPQRRVELVTSLFGSTGRMSIELDKLELNMDMAA